MKTKFRKELNKEIEAKLLLKDASVLKITRHLMGRGGRRLVAFYRGHDKLVWECMAGIGWALFVLRFWGVV